VGCVLVDSRPPETCRGDVTVPSSLGWSWNDGCKYEAVVEPTGDNYVCPQSAGGGDCIVGNEIPTSGTSKNLAAWKNLQVCASDGKTPCVKCSDKQSGFKDGKCCGYFNHANFNTGLPPCVDPKSGETCKPNV